MENREKQLVLTLHIGEAGIREFGRFMPNLFSCTLNYKVTDIINMDKHKKTEEKRSNKQDKESTAQGTVVL